MPSEERPPYNNTNSARRHVIITFAATTAAAIAANLNYKGIYFTEDGDADIVDSAGTLVTVTVFAGLVYPVQNWGIVTGGGTTISAGTAFGLYD